MATVYRLDFRLRWGQEFLLLPIVQIGSGDHRASCPMCTGVLSLGVNRPEREADHYLPTSAEDKKTWIHISTPPYVFMASSWLHYLSTGTAIFVPYPMWVPLRHNSCYMAYTVHPSWLLIIDPVGFISGLFLSGCPTKTSYTFLYYSCVLHALPISYSLTCHSSYTSRRVQVMKLLIM
jgi:hypothetical protein